MLRGSSLRSEKGDPLTPQTEGLPQDEGAAETSPLQAAYGERSPGRWTDRPQSTEEPVWTGPLLLEPRRSRLGKKSGPNRVLLQASAPGSWGTLQAETRQDLDQIRNQSLLRPCSQKETRIQVLSHFLLRSQSYTLPFVIFMSLAATLGEPPGLSLPACLFSACVCVCVCRKVTHN